MSRPFPVTEEQANAMIREYLSGVSRNKLSSKYGINRYAVTACLQRSGVKYRGIQEASVLHNGLAAHHFAFTDPKHNEAASYWIGFLMADGCISFPTRSGHPGNPHVILVLSAVDECHVRNFRSFLQSEHAIQRIPATTGRRINSGEMSRLDVVSPRMVADLGRYGVVPQKTARTKAHRSMQNNRHFWRGLVDGDGWIGTSRRKSGRVSPQINITGSEKLLDQWSDFMRTITPTLRTPCRDKSVWQCGASGRHAIRVIHALYSDCQIALPRKLQAAQRLLKEFGFLLDQNIGYHWQD